MAGKPGRKSILDMIPDDFDDKNVEFPERFRKAPPAPAAATPHLEGLAGVPAPRAPLSDAHELLPQEREDFEACEAAVDTLRKAFWAAGKALQVIRDARLYRETHPTFEDYIEDRWQMSRPQAYRLIAAWPLAEALSPIGDNRLNEGQVRELLPLAERHGQDAAVTVYRTIAETDGVKVTATVLKGAVTALPSDHFDAAQAVEQIRAYLRGESTEQLPQPAVTATEAFTADAIRLQKLLRRVVSRRTLRAAATERPEEVRAVVSELRHLLEELEKDLPSS